LENFLARNHLPVENYPPIDFKTKSFDPSSFRDYDEKTGTSALHSELQRGPLSLKTVEKLMGAALAPTKPNTERFVNNRLYFGIVKDYGYYYEDD
jgi:hypothetical protein